MARNKLFSKRIELCVTPEQLKVIKSIAKKLKTTSNEAIRICISDYWEKI